MNCKLKTSTSKSRNSAVELLKIIAIIFIVTNHVVQTIHFIYEKDYLLDITRATTNIQYLILAILRYGGTIGNTIFFMCSAWFLLDNDKVNKKKILQMLMDIWVVSVVILAIVYCLRHGAVGMGTIVKQLFPTTFHNNWYMTCYLIFYPIHPFLNWIINKMSKVTLFRTVLISSFLYIGINYLMPDHFFTSYLIMWMIIYLIIAYIKYYLVDMSNNIKINLTFMGIGILGNCGMVLLTNYMGLRIGALSNMLLRWAVNCSPFTILMAIGMLNVARNIHFKSKVINYISSLSMLIYIIHENYLLRMYYRPLLWRRIYTYNGHKDLVLWTFITIAIVFGFGVVASIIYKNTIQKIVTKITNAIYPLLYKKYRKIEIILLKLH